MNLLNLPSLHPHKVGVSSAHLQHRWACLCAPATDGLSAPSGWACIDSRPQRGTGTPAPWTRTHSISDKPAREPSRRDRWATAKTHASNLNCGSGPPEQNLQFCSPSNVVGHVTLTTNATSSYGYGVSGRKQDAENQRLDDCDWHVGSPQVSPLISPAHSRVFSWRRWALDELPHVSWPVMIIYTHTNAVRKKKRGCRGVQYLFLHRDVIRTPVMYDESLQRVKNLHMQVFRLDAF